MRLHHVLLLALLSTATPVLAQVNDHLTPPPDALLGDNESTAYRANVGRRLGRALAQSPLAQVVVYPSFEPEYLLSIEYGGPDTYILKYCKAQRNIWYASPHKLPANVTLLDQHGTKVAPPKPVAAPDSIPLARYQVVLQPRLAQALTDLFHVALAQTRCANDHLVRIDGTRFTFITWDALEGYRSGDTWSPAPASNMGRLVNIVASLQDLATHTDERDFRQGLLFSEAQDLLFDLAAR